MSFYKRFIERFLRSEDGMSFTETAILFPVLLSLMMAIYDLGQGIVISQKTMSASQIIADLIARNEVVDIDTVDNVLIAGELALDPYPNTSFGSDVISVEFDEDSDPVILWRVTTNMVGDDDALNSTDGLGEEGEGVVIVSVVNEYVPFFSGFVVPTIEMSERAFVRGRTSSTVLCTDCP